MDNISIFLEKYGKIGLKESQIKQSLINSIKCNCDVCLEEKEIVITPNRIKIEVSGSKKSEIYLNLEKIEIDFNKELVKINLKLERDIF